MSVVDTAVGLAKAYLELCGYFVLAELPVRTADRSGYHDVTDLDIIAVRFPHAPDQLRGPTAPPLAVFLGADPALETFEEGVDVIIGEVKEGEARLNPALQRAETIAFALRRLGCCPSERIEDEARILARAGKLDTAMGVSLQCHIRLVAFVGYGHPVQRGVHTVPLHRCAEFIAQRLREGRGVLAGVQFKDSVLSWFVLQAKLAQHGERNDREVSSRSRAWSTRTGPANHGVE